MPRPTLLLACILALAVPVAARAAAPPAPPPAAAEDRARLLGALGHHVSSTEAATLVDELDAAAAALARDLAAHGTAPPRAVRAFLRHRVASWLLDLHADGLHHDADAIRQQGIAFHAWQARAFVTGGVFPKRYFGYLDARGDTVALEIRLARAIRSATDACNAWLAEQGIPWRVTDQELAITWLAEGGALLLGPLQDSADRVHPILGIGLDDIAHGFKELPGLGERVDAALGTDVVGIPTWQDGEWGLSRHMTFEETVAGTAVMWVWEKRIADRKLRAEGRPAMHTYDRRTQFVLASLVYNSGLIHSPSRPAQVQRYALADHLAGLAAKHNGSRPWLPVEHPAASVDQLLERLEYPEQPTSWIALYHILQRYGGYEAVERFTDAFDAEGRLRLEPFDAAEKRLAEASKAAGPADRSTPVATEEGRAVAVRGCGCGTAAGHGGWTLLLVGLIVRRRRFRTRPRAA